MRYAIIGLAIAGAVGASTLVYGQLATSPPDERQNWREQEIRFLKAALDRIQADLDHQSGGSALASLQRERDTLLQNMAALNKAASPGAIGDDPKPAVPAAEAPTKKPAAALREPVAPARPIELQLGPKMMVRAAPDLAGLDLDADLRAPLRPRKSSRTEPKDKEAKAAKDKAAKDKAARDKTATPAAEPR